MRGHAARAGWHGGSKVTKIEHGTRPPSADDIRTWCRVCHADREAPDLIAASRAADSMYVEWRRLQPTGLRHTQEARVPLYERTRVFKAYCPSVIPGWLQTPAYAAALLSAISAFHGTPDDTEDAVAARVSRNRVVRDGNHRFALLVEETALRYRIGAPDVMGAQLRHLLEVMELPWVALGVIPSASQRDMWPLEQFTVFDDNRVHVELLSAQVTVTVPSEIILYVRAYERLARLAVYGEAAQTLIADAIATLG